MSEYPTWLKPHCPNSSPCYGPIMTHLALPMNSEIDRAARYLEQRGFRFCIDFGTDNAVSIAECIDEFWNATRGPEGAD